MYTAGVVDLYFSCIYTAGIVDGFFFYCTCATGIVDRFFFIALIRLVLLMVFLLHL